MLQQTPSHPSCTLSNLWTTIVTQEIKTCHLSFWDFLTESYSTLHLLQTTYCRIKISCFLLKLYSFDYNNQKVKKLNKNFRIFCIITILCDYHFIILKLFCALKGFILYQIKQTALKSGYNFSTK